MNVLSGLWLAFGEWVKRLGWSVTVTDDEATELGFTPEDIEYVQAFVEALGAPASLLRVVMDAARFYNDSIDDATRMVVGAYVGQRNYLRRSGYPTFDGMRDAVDGCAARYALTFAGQRAVRLARQARAARNEAVSTPVR